LSAKPSNSPVNTNARTVLIALAIFIVESAALAQGSPLTPRQHQILDEVARVNGSLSRAQYDEFWKGFLSAAERERFRQSFRSELPAILRYQRTLWLAARESLRQRRPVITPELRREFEQAERKDRDSTPPQNRSTEMKRTAQALLEGAAYQTPVNKDGRTFPKDGRSFQITPEVIEQVLRGLDGSINRLERLLSESWQ
jgi:hypothetical protein